MDVIAYPKRTDAYRYSWESWCDDGQTIIVGLLDHHGDDSRPLMVMESARDAGILLSVLRSLDVKTPGGLPFDPPLTGHA
jgi:hypothetical protein